MARGPLTRTAVRLAAVSAGGTALVLSVLAGPTAAAVVVLCAGSVALVWWLRRRPAPGRRPGVEGPPVVLPAARWSPHPSERGAFPGTPRHALPPVATASVEELGREWQRTATVLETVVDLGVREQVVRRRGEVLDELERRDPAGFARWLVSGASVDGSPARHLRGDSTAGPA